MKTCKIENCNNPIWGNNLCRHHIPKKPLQAIRSSRMNDNTKQVVDTTPMREFFLELWKKRRHYSEISGVFLGHSPSHLFFHHILPKNKFPQFALNEENIVILLPEEHGNIESNPYRYDIINEKRKYLQTKHNIL
jgi:hypothetical protein